MTMLTFLRLAICQEGRIRRYWVSTRSADGQTLVYAVCNADGLSLSRILVVNRAVIVSERLAQFDRQNGGRLTVMRKDQIVSAIIRLPNWNYRQHAAHLQGRTLRQLTATYLSWGK